MLFLSDISLAEENLNDIPSILTVPTMTANASAAGRRVRATTKGWEKTEIYHVLYLPTDWKPDRKWPVIVEYPGNGGYRNAFGDVSDGTVEGCVMGYGLSGGEGFIWISMPFVSEKKNNATMWWGDIEETKRYCLETIREVCRTYGGDPKRVVLAGFSRGAIACNYVGLHDDEMARLWCGMVCHSHHDASLRHHASDDADWPKRLKRLGKTPQFISHEQSVQPIREAIKASGVLDTMENLTFAVLPFPNHSAAWTLRDLPIRQKARDWLFRVANTKRD